MSLLDKFKQKFTSEGNDYDTEDENYYPDDDYAEYPEEKEAEKSTNSAQTAEFSSSSIAMPSMGVNLSGSSIELKVVKPASYKDTNQIADHLLSGRTVVLNLEATNKETARRLIDFLTGVAYSISGDIKKVSTNTYVITPKNVAVSSDSMREKSQEAAQSGDYYSDLA
jgi:cell division inhibitor SepF